MPAHQTFATRRLRPLEAIRDLEVHRVGHLVEKRERVAHTFTFHAVVLVVAGHGDFRIDGGPEQAVGPGSYFVAYPGPQFDYGPDAGDSWEEHHLCLVGQRLEVFNQRGWLPRDGRVQEVADPSPLVWHYERIAETLYDPRPGNHDRACCYTEQFLLELDRARTEAGRARLTDPTMAQVLTWCRQHFAEPVDFRRLADLAGISYSLLRLRLKRITGQPPAHYLTRLRCEEAQRLLTRTDLSVAEIGERVGIEDPFSFSRTFKRTVGLSPLSFRRQVRPWGGRQARTLSTGRKI